MYEDVSLEKCAASIMSQFARRDIMIVDVDVYEYAKKQLSFKESKDGNGFIIKGQKFSVDKTANIVQEIGELTSEEEVQLPQQQQPQPQPVNMPQIHFAPPKPMQTTNAPVVHPHELLQNNNNRVMMWMVFDPELPQMEKVKSRNLKFTKLKKYPIYSMKEHPQGLQFGNLLTTTDDTGKRMEVSDEFFIPAQSKLAFDDEVGFSDNLNEPRPKLAFEGQFIDDYASDPMPIRQMPRQPQQMQVPKEALTLKNGQSIFDMPNLRRK
jgi:hypothetical protein